ncbi:carbon-nitrogen hydrolase family protein [Sediminicola luteus]|uniref:Aliphatic nitrilase n=1 Tax=Sediminicola luteus TaxID=319238 RepID=A0A2A4GD48_9FLAO|nr:carbon-nitrogen hydrolase family protein [Sediminicola luteus]PCE65896.1 aliphatic nitrilase [Sediminicola luteus]
MTALTKFKAAVVQTSPVFLDTAKTVDKACSIIREVGAAGAKMVAFPEVFISAYPYWSWVDNPVNASKWFAKLYHSAIYVDGPEVQALCQAARENDVNVVIGCNEKVRYSHGTMFNTNLIIDNTGTLIGAHRKLVPTWAEKMSWTGGDGSTLKTYKTNVGSLGTLACGENTNSLARFTLLSQGETVHVANYISLPVSPGDYDMASAIKIRAAAHSFEGKIFTLVSCSTISEEIIQLFEKENPQVRELFERKNSAFSGIIGPDGDNYVTPLIDDEGIVYADIDMEKTIQPKQMHDILGHYNRFDIFKLTVNTKKNEPIIYTDTPFEAEEKLIIKA